MTAANRQLSAMQRFRAENRELRLQDPTDETKHRGFLASIRLYEADTESGWPGLGQLRVAPLSRFYYFPRSKAYHDQVKLSLC